MKISVYQLIKNGENLLDSQVCLNGWIRSVRKQKNFSFAHLYDGSSFKEIQLVIPSNIDNDLITTGCCVCVNGNVTKSIGQKQNIEIKVTKIEVIGQCDPQNFPLQKKEHSMEFLRSISHIRSKSKTFSAIFRIRHELAIATHRFFSRRNFKYINTPIITGIDCEGAGEMFEISNKIDHQYFFGKKAFLTVSGQLNAEALCAGIGSVYTFGPTFRAENSNTSRHLSEFWMIEPEIAFCNLNELIEIADQYIKYIFSCLIEECSDEIQFCCEKINPQLINDLKTFVENPFPCISYSEAVSILKTYNNQFEFPIEWGNELQSEHEKFLCANITKLPTFIYNYPEMIKPFYAKQNSDGKTVANMDLVFPRVGEVIGGSQREDNLEVLINKLKKFNIPQEDYDWYIDIRRFGSFVHSGFGAGFERLIRLGTGIDNIRDVIPFPRFPMSAMF